MIKKKKKIMVNYIMLNKNNNYCIVINNFASYFQKTQFIKNNNN